MRIAAITTILALSSSAAVAGDLGGRSYPHRIFPSEVETYRSGTVPLHFVGWGEGDSGDPAGRGYGGYGGSYGSGHGDGGVDSLGKPRTANSLMRSDWGPYNTGDDYGGPQHGHSGSGGTAGDGGWGGYSAGDGGWGWD